ncbi:2OG-Fe(II) oxygenase [Membranihabitans marinus]|uniref:2OG-Fe(II) oxygenase n=1 Tax=Membranihabitans marinus TaxID=1227546 RepID=UPI001F387146|nr:2OG-Fe(II) oxygenase [Membranihabitans marinus]
MIETFETIINRYLTNKIGTTSGFLNNKLAVKLRTALVDLHDGELLKRAGIGSQAKLTTNQAIRGDKIYWLDRSHQNDTENLFLDIIDQFVSHLNTTCFAGITGYEFHYAWYEANSFYKRHLDQFENDSGRAYSMIIYLNEDWNEADGGQLCVYLDDRRELIPPISGSCVFFKSSELEHEVLLCHKPRLSVTGWLKTH